jgi:hypothetical protein
LLPEFSKLAVADEEEDEGALRSGELLLPDVPAHEPGVPGHGMYHLGRRIRRRVGQLIPKLGSKTNKKYKEKSAEKSASAC